MSATPSYCSHNCYMRPPTSSTCLSPVEEPHLVKPRAPPSDTRSIFVEDYGGQEHDTTWHSWCLPNQAAPARPLRPLPPAESVRPGGLGSAYRVVPSRSPGAL